MSVAESDASRARRPRGARVGAWAPPQSRVIASRAVLARGGAAIEARHRGRAVPRPPHWGGYRLVPRGIEFWQGRPDPLHDPIRYVRRGRGWRRGPLGPRGGPSRNPCFPPPSPPTPSYPPPFAPP